MHLYISVKGSFFNRYEVSEGSKTFQSMTLNLMVIAKNVIGTVHIRISFIIEYIALKFQG